MSRSWTVPKIVVLAFFLTQPAFGQCEVVIGSGLTAPFDVDGEWLFSNSAGAPEVVVFRDSTNGWGQFATLSPASGVGCAFGSSVSVSSARAVVGASSCTGSAYVFDFNGQDWVEREQLVAFDGFPLDYFGVDVAVSGDVIAVMNECDVYLFERIAAGWVFVQKFDQVTGGVYPYRLALDGDRLMVGKFSGVASFVRINGVWSQAPDIDVMGHGDFVQTVALDGNRMLVGDIGTGKATALENSNGVWTEIGGLVPFEPLQHHDFGWDLALSGGLAVVGAPAVSGGPLPGRAYVFSFLGGQWFCTDRLSPTIGQGFEHVGASARQVFGARGQRINGYDLPCTDCNRNGFDDADDIASGVSEDCNQNGWPDECDLQEGRSEDCDGSLVPDECEFTGFYDFYCACEFGAPCGNESSSGGCLNATGQGAQILAPCGSPSVGVDAIVVAAAGVPPNTAGLFYMGGGQQQAPFGNGQRCIASGGIGIFRYSVRVSGPAGRLVEGPGIVATSHQRFGPAGQIQPGQTWNFQAWFRDTLGPCGTGFNLSNAVAITFTP